MSIFDPSFHSAKKKIKPKQGTGIPSVQKPLISKAENPPNEDEVKQIFSKMQRMHEELNKKIDKAYQLSGKDPSEVDEYFNNPSHFQPKEWERLQERKETLEQSLLGLSKSELRKKKVKKHVSKMSKERKGKTLGARKNWLSMR